MKAVGCLVGLIMFAATVYVVSLTTDDALEEKTGSPGLLAGVVLILGLIITYKFTQPFFRKDSSDKDTSTPSKLEIQSMNNQEKKDKEAELRRRYSKVLNEEYFMYLKGHNREREIEELEKTFYEYIEDMKKKMRLTITDDELAEMKEKYIKRFGKR